MFYGKVFSFRNILIINSVEKQNPAGKIRLPAGFCTGLIIDLIGGNYTNSAIPDLPA